MWHLSLNHLKKENQTCNFHLAISLKTHSLDRKLPCCEGTRAAFWRGPCGEELRPLPEATLPTSHMHEPSENWILQLQWSLHGTAVPGDTWTVTSWEVLGQKERPLVPNVSNSSSPYSEILCEIIHVHCYFKLIGFMEIWGTAVDHQYIMVLKSMGLGCLDGSVI